MDRVAGTYKCFYPSYHCFTLNLAFIEDLVALGCELGETADLL